MQHVLFDLDGTLLDPAEGIVASFTKGLEACGVTPPASRELHWVIGPPLRVSLPKAGVAPADVERALAAYRKTYTAGAMFRARAYDGIGASLAAFRARGHTLHVATSKPHMFARPILEHFGLAHHFAGIFGAELDGTRDAKADVIAHLLATQGVAARDAIMIGDREHDCNGARTHGIPTIGVAWGYGGRAELEAAGAAAIATHASELLPLVTQLAQNRA